MDKFLGFRGRIGRGRWWLGILTLMIVGAIIYGIAAFLLGLPFSLLASSPTPEVMAEFQRVNGAIGLITLVALIYPAMSMTAQRLNDRNRPTALVWFAFIPTVLLQIANAFGLVFNWTATNGVLSGQMTIIGLVLYAAAAVIGLWLLIDLGILRGTKGPNRHGPDPLER